MLCAFFSHFFQLSTSNARVERGEGREVVEPLEIVVEINIIVINNPWALILF